MKAVSEDFALIDEVVEDHLGHYNGHVASAVKWGFMHAEGLANLIEDRDAFALRHMTGREGWVKDRDEWRPILVRACEAMVGEMLARGVRLSES